MLGLTVSICQDDNLFQSMFLLSILLFFLFLKWFVFQLYLKITELIMTALDVNKSVNREFIIALII